MGHLNHLSFSGPSCNVKTAPATRRYPARIATGSNMAKRYFDDLIDGECLRCQPALMTEEAILDFARKFDPQPFHVDQDAGRASIFGGLIASSLHTLSACTRVIVEAQGDMAILSGVGMDQVKMFNPVRPGDTLSVEAWWTDLKRSRSKPHLGFAAIRCRVNNQEGEPVIEYGYRYMVACRPPQTHDPLDRT
jgi:acyl dehydratase